MRRYDVVASTSGEASEVEAENPDGEYVLFADVEPILAEVGLLRKVESAAKAIQGSPDFGGTWTGWPGYLAAQAALDAFRAGGGG